MSKRLPAIATFGTELLLWLLPATCFLSAFILFFNGPNSAIVPHLKLVGSLACAWLGLRLVVEHLGSGRVPRTLFQLLYSLCLTFLLLYYTTILIGLQSWGRIPTWRLITIYFNQWRELAVVLDMPVVVIPLALCFLCAAVFLLVRTAHARLHWPHQFATIVRPRISLFVAVAGIVLFSAFAVETYKGIDSLSGEPFMMSLNPGVGAETTQHNQSEGARLLDRREAEAAAAYRPGELAAPRNVILIVGDALRGDHLSTFQYSRPTTPYFDSLAEAGRLALAQRIHSVCAESYCGLMSIARSKFVHEFSRASITLQQVLARHGYRIELILGGDHTNFYGLSEALGPADLYWDGSMGERYVNDDRAVIERSSQLSSWDGRPVFLQLHLMSSHGLGKREESYVRFAPARNYYRRWPGIDEETKRTWASNYYDNGLLQFDSMVKELLATLQQRGYLEDALVIITGDHGEMLGEHGNYGHAAGVRRPVLDIPLLMLRYGYEGLKLEPRTGASQVDIAPTVLQELGLPVPSSWSGTALQNPTQRPFLYFQQDQEVGLLDLRDTDNAWKYWTDMRSDSSYAFDVTRDPEESLNLIGEVPSRLRSEWILQLLPASNTVGEQKSGDLLDDSVRPTASEK